MAESSFPVIGQPMTDQQWGQVTVGMGSGVLGQPSGNYAYSAVDNATNTALLLAGTDQAQAIVAGFQHRIDADHRISIPAVTSGTSTYHVGLTYDPTRHESPSGPVSITVTTSRPSGSGKVYLPLYEVTRSANELLSDADVRVRRVLISPTLSVADIDELPEASTMMQGTLCQTSNLNMLWRASGDRWVPIGATALGDPWSMSGWSQVLPVGGIELSYLASGTRIAKATGVHFVRTGSAFTAGTSFQVVGTFIPPVYRGTGSPVHFQASLLTSSAVHTGAVRLNPATGDIAFRLGSGSQTIHPGHQILFSAAWEID